jgi:hypothetical protein
MDWWLRGEKEDDYVSFRPMGGLGSLGRELDLRWGLVWFFRFPIASKSSL